MTQTEPQKAETKALLKESKTLLKEILKTDKVINRFKNQACKFLEHQDKSNSSKYTRISEKVKEILEEMEDY